MQVREQETTVISRSFAGLRDALFKTLLPTRVANDDREKPPLLGMDLDDIQDFLLLRQQGQATAIEGFFW